MDQGWWTQHACKKLNKKLSLTTESWIIFCLNSERKHRKLTKPHRQVVGDAVLQLRHQLNVFVCVCGLFHGKRFKVTLEWVQDLPGNEYSHIQQQQHSQHCVQLPDLNTLEDIRLCYSLQIWTSWQWQGYTTAPRSEHPGKVMLQLPDLNTPPRSEHPGRVMLQLPDLNTLAKLCYSSQIWTPWQSYATAPRSEHPGRGKVMLQLPDLNTLEWARLYYSSQIWTPWKGQGYTTAPGSEHPGRCMVMLWLPDLYALNDEWSCYSSWIWTHWIM